MPTTPTTIAPPNCPAWFAANHANDPTSHAVILAQMPDGGPVIELWMGAANADRPEDRVPAAYTDGVSDEHLSADDLADLGALFTDAAERMRELLAEEEAGR